MPGGNKNRSAPVVAMSKDPLRSRSWRWERAKYLSDKRSDGKPKHHKTSADDSYIIRARDALSRIFNSIDWVELIGKGVESCPDYYTLRMNDTGMVDALRIFLKEGISRWALEAMIMARQPSETIAEQLGCKPAVIDTYEHVYFDVRGRLDNPFYIMDELFTPALVNDSIGKDCDVLWKVVGYWYGPDALKSLMLYGSLSADQRRSMLDVAEDIQHRKLLSAVVVRAANQYNAHEIVDEYQNARAIDADADKDDATRQMARGASALIEAVRYTLADSGERMERPAVELRVEERIKALSSGTDSDKNVEESVLQSRMQAKESDERRKAGITVETLTEESKKHAEQVRKEARKSAEDARRQAAKRLRKKASK